MDLFLPLVMALALFGVLAAAAGAESRDGFERQSSFGRQDH